MSDPGAVCDRCTCTAPDPLTIRAWELHPDGATQDIVHVGCGRIVRTDFRACISFLHYIRFLACAPVWCLGPWLGVPVLLCLLATLRLGTPALFVWASIVVPPTRLELRVPLRFLAIAYIAIPVLIPRLVGYVLYEEATVNRRT